jgi:putative oxidoreductase
MDLGLLLLRLALAAILYMHATQKLFGWFSGPGLDRQAQVFHNLGHRPGRQMVLLSAACELSGSALIALGLITPLGAAILAGTMIVAGGTLTLAKGIVWNVMGGGEYPLALAAVAVVLGFTGPGRWSIDNAIGAPWVSHGNGTAAITGVIVLAVAALAAAAALLRTRSLLRPAAAPPEAAPPEAAPPEAAPPEAAAPAPKVSEG